MTARSSLLLSAMIVASLGLARPAMAQYGYAPNCSVDPVLVGNTTGNSITTAGNRHGFTVVIRDENNQPVPYITVTIAVSRTGARFYTSQASGTTVSCTGGGSSISKDADATGTVNFTPRMGGFENSGSAVEVTTGVFNLIKDGIPCRSTDINANGSTDVSDISTFSTAFLALTYRPELDFNADGVLNAADFSIISGEFLSGQSYSVCQ